MQFLTVSFNFLTSNKSSLSIALAFDVPTPAATGKILSIILPNVPGTENAAIPTKINANNNIIIAINIRNPV